MTTAQGVTIITDTDSDEESPPKQTRGSRSKSGRGRKTSQAKTSKDESTSKQTRNSRSKRGRGKLQITRTTNSSKQFSRKSVITDEDDSLILQDESFHGSHQLSDEEVSSSVTAENNENDACLLRTTETADVVLLTENCAPAVSQPRKTTKRGLAKKHCESPPKSDCATATSHKVSVYSQAVDEEFKCLLHGVSSTGAKTGVDEPGERVTTKTEESGTELSGINLDISLMESQKIFSKQDEDKYEDEVDEKLITSITIQSPSPPAKAFATRAKPMSRKLTRALKALNEAKISLDRKTPPSKYRRRDSDVIIVEEESYINDIVVKVRYLTKVHRIQMKMNEPFHVLTTKLSSEVQEAEHNLGLFLHDRSLEVTETPQSVKLSVADIIECHYIKVSEDSVCSSDAVELVIQCRNNRSKTTIVANKRRPLNDVIQKYAQLTNVDPCSFIFSFDGEDVEPSDTPSKLEMEDHDVIDVVHI